MIRGWVPVFLCVFCIPSFLFSDPVLVTSGKKGVSYFNQVPRRANLNKQDILDEDRLVLLNFSFRPVASNKNSFFSGNQLEFRLGVQDDSDIEPEILGDVLNYPNPFRQEEGTDIGYRLSKDLDITFQIFDIVSHLVYENTYLAGSVGGRKGFNRLILNMDTLDNFALSTGVYFYLIIHNGAVLGKGKMAIVP